MSYREQEWGSRFTTLGDIAEKVFIDASPLGRVERLGWRRPAVSLKLMGSNIRHQPDFYSSSGHLVEVMGLGRDGILKLKTEKWDALKWWNQSGNNVVLFVWNSHKEEYALVPWDTLKGLVLKARTAGVEAFEVDGNQYLPIQWEWIAKTCIPVPWETAA